MAGVCIKALRFWSRATEAREPCQAGNRAAISGVFGVLRGCQAEPAANVPHGKPVSKQRCTAFFNFRKVRFRFARVK